MRCDERKTGESREGTLPSTHLVFLGSFCLPVDVLLLLLLPSSLSFGKTFMAKAVFKSCVCVFMCVCVCANV